MSVERKNGSFTPSVEDLLFTETTVGGDVLDRAFFYELTEGWSPEALEALKERVTARVQDFYRGVASVQGTDPAETARDVESAARDVGMWFTEGSRLGGMLDSALEGFVRERGAANVTPEELSSFVDGFRERPEFSSHADRLVGWMYNRCREYGWDYTRVSDPYTTVDQVKFFIYGYPYLVEERRRDFASFMVGRLGSSTPEGAELRLADGDLFLQGRKVRSLVADRRSRDVRVVFNFFGPDGREAVPVDSLSREDRDVLFGRLGGLWERSPRLREDWHDEERKASKGLRRKPGGPSL